MAPPVIALREGSVPEVIEHGVTGFVCDTEDEMVEAIGHVGELDRATLSPGGRASILTRAHGRAV